MSYSQNHQPTWILAEKAPPSFFRQFPELPPVVAQLLYNRRLLSQEQVDEFFSPDYHTHVHDPFLFQDMEGAVARVFQALDQEETIVVYGDYDVDGVAGAAILLTTLKRLGAGKVHVHLPHREKEGYGLNEEAVREFIRMRASLLITVDCGIANAEEVKQAKDGGMDVIIVDHHKPKEEVPPANFILHCGIEGERYPFRKLSGGGTAFKFAQALLARSLSSHEAFEKWMLDLVALSTVADMVELMGENRTLVRYGLMVLNKTQRRGLRALLRRIGRSLGTITAEDISWKIAPRLNAAGRMDHANAALELVMADSDEEADRLANLIHEQNNERQRETEQMVKEIRERIGEVPDSQKGICVFGESWSPALLGLTAGRIEREFARPVFIVTFSQGRWVGSGRGPAGVDLVSLLEAVHERVPLTRFGGHAQACGFSLDKGSKEAFLEVFHGVAQNMLADFTPEVTLDLEAELSLRDITWDIVDMLVKFEPFGVGNPRPHFLIPSCEVVGIQRVGNGESHLKMRVQERGGGVVRSAIGFGHGAEWGERLRVGDVVDLACEIGVNEWNGNREIQMKIIDIRMSE